MQTTRYRLRRRQHHHHHHQQQCHAVCHFECTVPRYWRKEWKMNRKYSTNNSLAVLSSKRLLIIPSGRCGTITTISAIIIGSERKWQEQNCGERHVFFFGFRSESPLLRACGTSTLHKRTQIRFVACISLLKYIHIEKSILHTYNHAGTRRHPFVHADPPS